MGFSSMRYVFWCEKSASNSAQQFVYALASHPTMRKFKRDTSKTTTLSFWWSAVGAGPASVALATLARAHGGNCRLPRPLRNVNESRWHEVLANDRSSSATSAEMKKIAKTLQAHRQ